MLFVERSVYIEKASGERCRIVRKSLTSEAFCLYVGGMDVKSVLFSGGTYQIEVVDGNSYWIFLHLDDLGDVRDQFCSCGETSDGKECAHVGVGKEAVFRGYKFPLHVRFRSSLWFELFRILGRRYGYLPKLKRGASGAYEVVIPSGKKVFSLEMISNGAQEFAIEWIDERKKETEETSLKFSNLAADELEKYRRGRPSEALEFELSLWSDLAKWFMVLEDEGKEFSVSFTEYERGLPEYVLIKVLDATLEVYLEEDDFPKIIPAIASYKTNLKVFDFKEIEVEKISYDSSHKQFKIESIPLLDIDHPDFEWDDWTFQKAVGFFPKKTNAFFKKDVIEEKLIPEFLEKHARILEKYLVGTPLSRKPRSVSYKLFFDEQGSFHIEAYLFSPGDLTSLRSHFFDPWAYVDEKGFFRITNLLFKGTEKVIPKELMGEFIERNKNWLNKYREFQIHLSSVETKFNYRIEDEVLVIEKEDVFKEGALDAIDLGSFVYIKGEGFFSRREKILQGVALEPVEIDAPSISSYIHAHKDDLDHIRNFFSPESGLEKTGLNISLVKENIVIEPVYFFKDWAKICSPKIYGDFVYLKEKGFAEVPDNLKLPSKFTEKVVISVDQIPYFIKHELKRLKSQVIHLDKRLMDPPSLRLVVKDVLRKEKGWLVYFSYSSQYGEVPIREIYDAMLSFAPFVLSDAGMISLTEKRFYWLSRLSKSSFEQGSSYLYLTTLDWIRLSLFEEVYMPDSSKPDVKEFGEILKNLIEEGPTAEMPNLGGLKSTLRPYQEVGVRWLWFLYNYGLSGFLCDEMGLGKTHQAMALLSAAMHEKKRSMRYKFLVVAPTSVIYHWQDLLAKFLPKSKVHLYHGPFRNPKALNLKNDIILTTYGILRSDKDLFLAHDFEIAIFDETHVAKNHKSQIHIALKQIKAEMKLALTGTPLENNLMELKSLFDIILPGFLPSGDDFKEEFIAPIEKNKDMDRQKALSKLIKPFILRRKKQDVLLDLPEKIEEIAYVDLSDEQSRMYQEIAQQSKSILEEEGPGFYIHVFALLNKLKQVCDHPSLITKDENYFEKHQSGKWELFVELLNEALASGQKVVVFSQYLKMLDIIECYLKKEKIGFAGIRGTTKDRKGEVKRFQEDPSCKVFVASLQAAGVGIDLTAASVVIHYDRWWNPAKENQATDRVHRIGQNRGISVFKFVAKDTIEEHIHGIIEKKKDLISSVIGFDNEQDLKRIDRKELTALLKKLYATA